MPVRQSFLHTHGVPELLAPAGGPEPFDAALAAGADAIYCGLGNDFNARRGARNFTDETFAEACRRAQKDGGRAIVHAFVANIPKMMFLFLPLIILAPPTRPG